jgi:hypothetical protein
MIDALPEPPSTLVAAAAFTGARRGELRGMFGRTIGTANCWLRAQSGTASLPTPRAARARHRFRSFRNSPPSWRLTANVLGNPELATQWTRSLLRRMILPALEVCGVCSKPESEHGKSASRLQTEQGTPCVAWLACVLPLPGNETQSLGMESGPAFGSPTIHQPSTGFS